MPKIPLDLLHVCSMSAQVLRLMLSRSLSIWNLLLWLFIFNLNICCNFLSCERYGRCFQTLVFCYFLHVFSAGSRHVFGRCSPGPSASLEASRRHFPYMFITSLMLMGPPHHPQLWGLHFLHRALQQGFSSKAAVSTRTSSAKCHLCCWPCKQ